MVQSDKETLFDSGDITVEKTLITSSELETLIAKEDVVVIDTRAQSGSNGTAS